MNKKLYISKKIKAIGAVVYYYLVADRYEDIENGISTYTFGIEVIKSQKDRFGVEFMQRKTIPSLSVSKDKVLEFLTVLSDNDVMPIGVLDIVEDYNADGFFEKDVIVRKTA